MTSSQFFGVIQQHYRNRVISYVVTALCDTVLQTSLDSVTSTLSSLSSLSLSSSLSFSIFDSL